MKNTIITLVFVLFTGSVLAQGAGFEEAIKATRTLLDSARTREQLQAAAAKFERIAAAEPASWEPLYYHAYAHIRLSFAQKDGDTKDALLDVAQESIDQALAKEGNASELYALQGFLYQGRIQVSAMRGMSYSQKAAEILEKAVQENPNNPRALFLLGQNILHTPAMFGGGSKKALPKFEEAAVLFDREKEKTGIMPTWGRIANRKMMDACMK